MKPAGCCLKKKMEKLLPSWVAASSAPESRIHNLGFFFRSLLCRVVNLVPWFVLGPKADASPALGKGRACLKKDIERLIEKEYLGSFRREYEGYKGGNLTLDPNEHQVGNPSNLTASIHGGPHLARASKKSHERYV